MLCCVSVFASAAVRSTGTSPWGRPARLGALRGAAGVAPFRVVYRTESDETSRWLRTVTRTARDSALRLGFQRGAQRTARLRERGFHLIGFLYRFDLHFTNSIQPRAMHRNGLQRLTSSTHTSHHEHVCFRSRETRYCRTCTLPRPTDQPRRAPKSEQSRPTRL